MIRKGNSNKIGSLLEVSVTILTKNMTRSYKTNFACYNIWPVRTQAV
jgi:hypothetical protein